MNIFNISRIINSISTSNKSLNSQYPPFILHPSLQKFNTALSSVQLRHFISVQTNEEFSQFPSNRIELFSAYVRQLEDISLDASDHLAHLK